VVDYPVEVDYLDYYRDLIPVGADYRVEVLCQGEVGAVNHPAAVVAHLPEELLQDLVLQAHHYILYS
jgi:hypothetical protein